MFKRLTLQVQSLILITVIPAILLVVIIMASVLYSDLYNTILNGFDRKLFALGSSVASFIDGEEHQSVSEMMQFRGIAYRQDKLYANTFTGVHLLEIDPVSGNIRRLPNEIGYEAINGLTYVPKKDRLYGVVFESKELIEINPSSGQGRLVGVLEHDVFGIAYSQDLGMVGSTFDELVEIDHEKATSSVIGPLEVLEIQGLTFHQNKLIAMDTETSTLYEINLKDASSKKMIDIIHPNGEPILFGSFGITSDGTDLYLATTTPIFQVSSKGIATKINIADSQWRRLNDIYAKYVVPMIKIKNETDATFLYTALLKNQAEQIYYNIDSTQSPIHSFVGYTDPDPAADGVKDVWLKGEPFLSEITFWEEWGLLKSSYIPIKSKSGKVRGYAGADVNIDVINRKTKEMLFLIVIAGLLAIFLGILISLTMTRTLTQPIEILKRVALEIASGSFGLSVPKSNITEIEELSQSFNSLSNSLESKISSLSEEINQKDKASAIREVTNWLSTGEPSNLLVKWNSEEVHLDIADKMLGKSKILLFWQITDKSLSNVEKANLSAAIRIFLSKETATKNVKELVELVSLYFGRFLDNLGIIDFREQRLEFYSIANSTNYLAILDRETGKTQKIITSTDIGRGEFEQMKRSYFLLFGEVEVLEKLKNVKPEQLKTQSLIMMMEIISQLLNIKIKAALGTPLEQGL